MLGHVDVAIGRDGWGDFESDDAFIICDWRLTNHWRTRLDVPVLSPREFMDFGLDERRRYSSRPAQIRVWGG